MRKASLERITKETEIKADINLEGNGRNKIKTGIGFLDHDGQSCPIACGRVEDGTLRGCGKISWSGHY